MMKKTKKIIINYFKKRRTQPIVVLIPKGYCADLADVPPYPQKSLHDFLKDF